MAFGQKNNSKFESYVFGSSIKELLNANKHFDTALVSAKILRENQRCNALQAV